LKIKLLIMREDPLIFYNKNRKNSKQLYYYYYDKYVKHKKSKYFLKLDMGLHISPVKFIPGRFYTFWYNPLYKNILDYYDRRPLMLMHRQFTAESTKNEIIGGLNFNFLPERVKLTIIKYYYDTFKDEFESEIDNYYENDKEFMIKTDNFISLVTDWLKHKQLFADKNVNLSFAYRSYIIDRIKNVAFIEYDDWNMIPLLKSDYMVGASYSKIITDYYNSLP